jgi:F0F1-type ATP synthase assembly protein I
LSRPEKPGDSPEEGGSAGGGWQKVLREAAPYLGIGTSLAVTVSLCVWAGHWLDRKLGTEPLFLLAGAVFGMGAAGYHFYRTVQTMGSKR